MFEAVGKLIDDLCCCCFRRRVNINIQQIPPLFNPGIGGDQMMQSASAIGCQIQIPVPKFDFEESCKKTNAKAEAVRRELLMDHQVTP